MCLKYSYNIHEKFLVSYIHLLSYSVFAKKLFAWHWRCSPRWITEPRSVWNNIRAIPGEEPGGAGNAAAIWKPTEAASAGEERMESDQLHIPRERPAGSLRHGAGRRIVNRQNRSLDRVGWVDGMQRHRVWTGGTADSAPCLRVDDRRCVQSGDGSRQRAVLGRRSYVRRCRQRARENLLSRRNRNARADAQQEVKFFY